MTKHMLDAGGNLERAHDVGDRHGAIKGSGGRYVAPTEVARVADMTERMS